MRKAEESERRAIRRLEQIRESERLILKKRWSVQRKFWDDRNFDIELDVLTSKSRSADPVWKAHVSDNQWFISKATMYGVAATNELLATLIEQQRS